MSAPLRVAVVEDDHSMRTALVRLLSAAGIEATSHASADEFVREEDCAGFDCLVVDVHLPRMDGLQLQAELKRIAPFASLIFITGRGDLALGMHAMRQGAIDFLEKPVDEEALLAAIRRGADQSRKQRETHAERLQLEQRCESLTPREREVFGLITRGLLNKQAGAELGTTERTIKAHRARVMEKMGADSLAKLVRMAALLGIHEPSN
ncbi:MAG TPA: response regulator [Candidatus Binataceae bacterium]|nr:response regulator [Candidatus Binataceae bacterium]